LACEPKARIRAGAAEQHSASRLGLESNGRKEGFRLGKVFLFAFTAALNPTLLTATTVMLLLERPKRLLLGYWLGAMTTGVTVGLAIVHWLSGSQTVETSKRTVDPVINITLGVLALVIAAVLATGRLGPKESPQPEKKEKQKPRWQRMLSRGSMRATFVVGILLSFPGASYLVSLNAIRQQDLHPLALLATVVAVNLIMLILLELPLIGYLVAPDATPDAVGRFKGWFARNGRRAVTIAAAVIGVLLIIRGVVNF
jgi:hypothetical protein